jgi:DNA-binding NarL/FixJ family response regulator
MRQRPHMRASQNHRDDHRPRLVTADTAEEVGGGARALEFSAARSHRRVIDGADRAAENVVPLFGPRMSSTGRAGAPIRVLLAGGQPLVRAGYRILLESDELIEVVAEAATGEEAVARVPDAGPDVVVLDVGLLGPDAWDAAARFGAHAACADVPVILIAPPRSDDHVPDALLAGAAGVLAKDADPTELICAVQVVARGQALLPAGVVRRLVGELPEADGPATVPSGQIEELTEREREVMVLVAKGLSNQEIAARLAISPATTKTHVGRAMLKLRASHRAQLVVRAYETGLVHPTSTR